MSNCIPSKYFGINDTEEIKNVFNYIFQPTSCPGCGKKNIYIFKDKIRFKCADCYLQFTHKSIGVFKACKLSATILIYSMWVYNSNHKISIRNLQTHISISIPSCFLLLKRIKSINSQQWDRFNNIKHLIKI